jgi:predicted metal-dependent hydrolase
MMDERFHQGIRNFNRRYFFEAHDVWEDFWHEYRDVDRLFLQGLIQVAVGFYHLENSNYKGSRSQFTKALAKLEAFLPHHQGIQTDRLFQSVKHWLAIAERLEQGESIFFDATQFPSIEYLQPEPVKRLQ